MASLNKCRLLSKFSKVKMMTDNVRNFSLGKVNHVHREIGVWGACFDMGQPHEGVGDAPALLRKRGLLEKLKAKGFQITDNGDISRMRTKDQDNRKSVFEFNEAVSTSVKKLLSEGKFCLTLGGDHSVGMGTVAGHLAADPEAVVLWVDAHADINTFTSTNSGNMHGMPLSFNIKDMEAENKQHMQNGELQWLSPGLRPSRLAFIGLRDVENGEWAYIQKFSIPTFSMKQIDRMGISQAVHSALQTVDPQGKRNIHVSFDIDSLDPKEAPATGTCVRGGLTLREALTLCEIVEETGRLKAFDLVEVNPSLAKSEVDLNLTLDAAVEVILAALGNPR